ncbi:hypothetical protein JCM19037_411 [Geomicrobium sp. JCM 19037]|uniref:hypothetical protein n=1 Tax=Geomicrobium sp. JCM 19037 TaxID=1460634 RepID=UPI00045F4174|nr:hypothetical protein [Geomicrobium sp. JCM 19037]GAK02193.1 hypothetical protein JCM19037_411 [Geomicrobium sp. JCM 19037]
MQFIVWMISGYVLLFVHVWVHELGHYLVGRYVVKIPKENIRIKLTEYPPHVALKDERGQWLKPGDEHGNYVHTYFKYDTAGKHSLIYVMGGFIFQSVSFLLVAFFIVYLFFNEPGISNFIVGGSFLFNLVYVAGDLIGSRVKRTPIGDTSAALQFAPVKTVLILSLLLASYVIVYIYVGFFGR